MNYDKSIRYVLKAGQFFIGNLDSKTLSNPLTSDQSKAMVLDYRDNEALKARFFSALLGVDVAAVKL